MVMRFRLHLLKSLRLLQLQHQKPYLLRRKTRHSLSVRKQVPVVFWTQRSQSFDGAEVGRIFPILCESSVYSAFCFLRSSSTVLCSDFGFDHCMLNRELFQSLRIWIGNDIESLN
jgi:hypothetical protein